MVGFRCIQTTLSDKPSMSKVVEMLEESLQSVQIPPKSFLFSPNLPGQEISSSFSTYVGTENSAQGKVLLKELARYNQPQYSIISLSIYLKFYVR